MEIQTFIEDTSKGIIPVTELTGIAADRRAFGDDVIQAFRTQIELRSAAAQTVLTTAETAGRDTRLASEQRAYDGHIRERDSLLSLQRQIEGRTEQRGYVPPTQVERATATQPNSGRRHLHDLPQWGAAAYETVVRRVIEKIFDRDRDEN